MTCSRSRQEASLGGSANQFTSGANTVSRAARSRRLKPSRALRRSSIVAISVIPRYRVLEQVGDLVGCRTISRARMTIETLTPPSVPPLPTGEEVPFPEARRLSWRRWTTGTLIAAVAIGAIVAIVELSTAGGAATPSPGAPAAGVLPNGHVVKLRLAGPLAVAPDGALYVADVARDRVLVRLPDGRFRVVAGNGRIGFSGDGGPALRAALSDVSDLTFAPNGTLYIADSGRVRVVGRDGIIRTIVGDGLSMRPISNGTPALSAPLGSAQSLRQSIAKGASQLSIALSPRGQLYI